MRDHQNPFEALDLDPSLSVADLTDTLRDIAESLPPEERSQVQGLWQQLTLRRDDRVRAALTARPRAVPQAAAALARRFAPPPPLPLTCAELQSQVSLLEVLPWPRHGGAQLTKPVALLTSLSEDPFWS